MSAPSTAERIMLRVSIESSGCWRWTGSLKPNGYGSTAIPLGLNRWKATLAHRLSYETFVGPIPKGLHLDHLCRNRACVNPDHLEPVTCRENLLRGETQAAANAAKERCPMGHQYDYAVPRGGRGCKECRREATRRWRARRAATTQTPRVGPLPSD